MLKRLLVAVMLLAGISFATGCDTTMARTNTHVHIKTAGKGPGGKIHVKENPSGTSVKVHAKVK